MAASITVHLQIFKRPQLLHFSTDLDETGIKNHGLLRSFIYIIVITRVAVPFKNGPGFPRMLCNVTCFQFDLVMMHLLRQQGVMSVFEEFNSSELNRKRSRYSFSSEKLVIF